MGSYLQYLRQKVLVADSENEQTAATMTMNSPESLTALHHLASADGDLKTAVAHAELMREVGLKCIGFNGVGQRRIAYLQLHFNVANADISGATHN